MSEIIKEMARIQLPQELLQQVDLSALVNKFNANHKRLGDFKDIRDSHESRGALKKIWDVFTLDNTLENAQLDAVEVQAAFSHTIGQLMVLSILQSQYLESQQLQLSKQQESIKQQTTSIEKHNEILEKQHDDLAGKSIELKSLVDNFVALKGFTHAEVKKLLEIAQKVEGTETQLRKDVEKTLSDALSQIGATEEQIKAELVKATELVRSTIAEAQAEIDKRLSSQLVDVGRQLASSNEKMSSIQDDFKLVQVDFEKRHEQVAAALMSLESKHGAKLESVAETLLEHSGKASQLEKNLTAQDGVLTRISADLESEHAFSVGVEQKLDALSKQLAVYQSNAKLKFKRLQIILGASMIFSIGLLGFIIFRM
jgi:hypothetical protein